MIRNDDELSVVREQLGRAESALESLRHDVLPKNVNLYRVMAESYVDTIVELRGHIEAYLGAGETRSEIVIVPTSKSPRFGNCGGELREFKGRQSS